ncbi:hypothetical protein DFO73_103443 [Cytobacillus oceanisediminis]|uniref:Uncharacterized protein n=1 Tax=Cytobacillus oceanisediminis TaxID=665099 RepID=A0A2V3A3R3_9BACI|nr:hypothetical protein [Cytobacillus oceanisediminis]PWW30550.1 hypothetical protein DFO73_103443 [Cytobacillus oceanisediminis]
MGRVVVKVSGRKKRTENSGKTISTFEKIRRDRQEENRKLLEQYNKEIKKVVNTR